eukprot:s187_g20.t3
MRCTCAHDNVVHAAMRYYTSKCVVGWLEVQSPVNPVTSFGIRNYVRMNGLNGDRFVTGTLTRPFSRQPQSLVPSPDRSESESGSLNRRLLAAAEAGDADYAWRHKQAEIRELQAVNRSLLRRVYSDAPEVQKTPPRRAEGLQNSSNCDEAAATGTTAVPDSQVHTPLDLSHEAVSFADEQASCVAPSADGSALQGAVTPNGNTTLQVKPSPVGSRIVERSSVLDQANTLEIRRLTSCVAKLEGHLNAQEEVLAAERARHKQDIQHLQSEALEEKKRMRRENAKKVAELQARGEELTEEVQEANNRAKEAERTMHSRISSMRQSSQRLKNQLQAEQKHSAEFEEYSAQREALEKSVAELEEELHGQEAAYAELHEEFAQQQLIASEEREALLKELADLSADASQVRQQCRDLNHHKEEHETLLARWQSHASNQEESLQAQRELEEQAARSTSLLKEELIEAQKTATTSSDRHQALLEEIRDERQAAALQLEELMQEARAKQRILQDLLNEGVVSTEEVKQIAAGEGESLQSWAAGFLRLTSGGECLHPNCLLGDMLNDGDSVLAIARPASLVSGNGACVSWGESSTASDSQIAHLLKNVDQIQTTTRAFAAVLEDGKVIAWGDPAYGGDITSVEALQRSHQVRKIQATDAAFAALQADATVVAWGDPKFGGDARKVQDELVDVQEIQSTSGAFAALLGDGTVVAWGAPDLGGNCSRVAHRLKSIRAIQSSSGAFAAIKCDGTVVTWGYRIYGGDSSDVQDNLIQVEQIQSTSNAFAAIMADGSVVSWGDRRFGGNSSRVQERLQHVQQIQSNHDAFAALLADGGVVTWGSARHGGDRLPNPDAVCDGLLASQRAEWLMGQGRSCQEAQRQVMQEFPAVFDMSQLWAGQTLCDGIRAEERAKWLVEHQQMTMEAAKQKVMQEFPRLFVCEDSEVGTDVIRGKLLTSVSPYPVAGSTGSTLTGTIEANPPRWPETVKVLPQGADYTVVDQIYEEMKSLDKGQFSKSRYAILFEPSATTHEVDVRVGYYTSVYGLGRHPSDTKVRSLTSTNESPHPELGSLQNFWRSAENLHTGGHPTYSLEGEGGMLWAVSQAAPLRRVVVDHNLFLWYLRLPPAGVSSQDARYPKQGVALDYDGWVQLGYTDPIGDFASGGYMANVQVNGCVNLGSQQQFFARNCVAKAWQKGAWNFVFVGCPGAPHSEPGHAVAPVYSNVATTKVIAEKPFIVKGPDGRYSLAVPAVADARCGVDFSLTEEELRDFSRVFVAHPRHTAAEINGKLAEGKDIVFCPGIYQLSETLRVKHCGQVLLGLGFATLVAPETDMPCVQVADEAAGIRISGLMFEAFYRPLGNKTLGDLSPGPEALLHMGSGQITRDASVASSWNFIHDCFSRVGGQEAPLTARDELDGSRPWSRPQSHEPLFTSEARCRSMVQIHQPCVVGDNLWLWRADHWLSDQYLVYNHENFCGSGLHVARPAHHVIMYGLFVEHTLSDMTLWQGEDGVTYFYQSELPYDAMDDAAGQTSRVAPFKACGYLVDQAVQRHEAVGVGVYAYFRDHDVTVPAAIKVPDHDGVRIQNALTKYLNGGPKTFVEGKCLLQCEKRYGRIQCIIQKGSRCVGSNTDADKDKPHFASA